MKKTQAPDRTTITNGYRWTRWIFAFAILFTIPETFSDLNALAINLSIALTCAIIFYLISKTRRLQFDDSALYIIRGKNETAVEFKQIKSIKASRARVNGSRFWILTYTDQAQKERTIWYFYSWFYDGFHKKVRTMNPAVVIWTHPDFHE